mmetsp:Transcript_26394/g.61165  ORF Transcript_26394/g.61165 Transcript_26394/m.61165 type:complete len:222 (+) Transcript_26394:3354-4019(+)
MGGQCRSAASLWVRNDSRRGRWRCTLKRWAWCCTGRVHQYGRPVSRRGTRRTATGCAASRERSTVRQAEGAFCAPQARRLPKIVLATPALWARSRSGVAPTAPRAPRVLPTVRACLSARRALRNRVAPQALWEFLWPSASASQELFTLGVPARTALRVQNARGETHHRGLFPGTGWTRNAADLEGIATVVTRRSARGTAGWRQSLLVRVRVTTLARLGAPV